MHLNYKVLWISVIGIPCTCGTNQSPTCTTRFIKTIAIPSWLVHFIQNHTVGTSQCFLQFPNNFPVPTIQTRPKIPAKMNKCMESPHVHYEVTVKAKRLRVQRFEEKIGLLLCRPCAVNLKLPVSHTRSRHVPSREDQYTGTSACNCSTRGKSLVWPSVQSPHPRMI